MGMRILLAIDGSEESAVALDLVGGTRWPSGSRVELLGIQDDAAPTFGDEAPPSLLAGGAERDDSREREKRAARDGLAGAAEHLRGLGIETDWELQEGDRLSVMLGEIGRLGVDVTVIGSDAARVADDVANAFSARLLDAAPGPILAARTPALGPLLVVAHAPGVAESVVATLAAWRLPDLVEGMVVLGVSSPNLPEAVEAAAGWVPEAEIEKGALEDEAAAERQLALAGVSRILESAGIPAAFRSVEADDPVDAVLAVAREVGASTIVTPIGRRIEAEPPLSERQREANRLGTELLARAPVSVLAIPVDRGAELSQAAHR
jgi:nucleotide-binding universal stress UspA family protein